MPRDRNRAVADLLVRTMQGRGKMSNGDIYYQVAAVCRELGEPVPSNDHVRSALQAFCLTAKQYCGGDDLFVHHDFGRWSCKAVALSVDSDFG
jgi:hypothetical protein